MKFIPNGTGKFRFWCQKVLPLVYDDSLSYYEVLCKLTNFVNELAERIANAFDEINTNVQEYVYDWLDDHPEATTTVQDGSITRPKIENNFLNEILNEFVTPEMYGAVGNGIADDTVPVQTAMDSGKPVFLSGHYRVTDTIDGSDTTQIISDGGKIVGDLDDTVLTFDKLEYEYLGNLTANVTKGSYTPAFSGANVGDIIVISSTDSFNTARSYYRHGEINKLITASLMEHAYYADYNRANTTAFRLIPKALNISGQLDVINTHESEDATAISISGIVAGNITGINASSAGTNAVRISRCYKCNIDINAECNANSYSTDYGLVIANSQDMQIKGNYYGNRHAIAVGGDDLALNIVNRYIKVDAITRNNSQLEQTSLDLHGNCEFCELTGMADTGVSIGGKNHIVSDVIIPENEKAIGVIGSELLAGDFVFANITADGTRSTTGIRLDSDVNTGEIYNVTVSNCVFSNTTGAIVMFRGNSSDAIKVTLSNVISKDNATNIVSNTRTNAPLANVLVSNVYNTDYQYNRCNKRQGTFYKGSFTITFNGTASVSQYITYPIQTTRPELRLQIKNPGSLGPVIIPTVNTLYGHEARIFSYTMSGADATGSVTCDYELFYADF